VNSNGRDAYKLTDDAVRAILFAPDIVTDVELARRFGVGPSTVRAYRQRRYKRALRIAHELGLDRRGRGRG